MRYVTVLLAVFCLAGTLPAADLGCGCVPTLKALPAKAPLKVCYCVEGQPCECGDGCLCVRLQAATPLVAPAPAAPLLPDYLLPQGTGNCPGGNCPGGNCNVQTSRGLFRRR